MNATETSDMFCDSHVHVVGDPVRYPLTGGRGYTPDPAPLATLQGQAGPLGITRFVIVQPSFYGNNNSLLLDTLDALEGQGRGVAAVDPAAGRDELGDLAARGVRGLRLNLYSNAAGVTGAVLQRRFEAMAALARECDFHVEIIAPIAMLAESAEFLRRSPVPVVVDHYGLFADETPDGLHGRALLALLRHPQFWMKLSAPYRSGGDILAVRPDRRWLGAIGECCGDRCVWGSDWPHTPPHEAQGRPESRVPYRALDYRAVFEGFRDSLPTDLPVERILRDNPARLYGFTA
ncbi:amidohydrolase family protein [Roseomonas elaeocarpi]|uniref:Amidohydrolase family protein n=1 Tax=Roseomonas elaeocarpi TaxID=907779 RepID=A0ABV6JM97_9PROT